jgi:hypothetical protein
MRKRGLKFGNCPLFLHRSTFIDIISPKNFTDALTAPPYSAIRIPHFL